MRWRVSALAATLLLAGCGPQLVADHPVKIGRPYHVRGITYVPADQPGYDALGTASWYGREQGRGRTANGERFSARRVSGAHTTLPLPSYVEVTALATGRTVLVRLNDRGPFVAGRLIDLSQAAAAELGILRAGTAAVRVRRVTPSERDSRRLRRGKPAELRPDASPETLAMLRAAFYGTPYGYGSGTPAGYDSGPPAGYGVPPPPPLSEPPQPIAAPPPGVGADVDVNEGIP